MSLVMITGIIVVVGLVLLYLITADNSQSQDNPAKAIIAMLNKVDHVKAEDLLFSKDKKMGVISDYAGGISYYFLYLREKPPVKKAEIPGFTVSSILWDERIYAIRTHNRHTYLVDSVQGKLCIIPRNSLSYKLFNSDDILRVDLVEHTDQTSKTISSIQRGVSGGIQPASLSAGSAGSALSGAGSKNITKEYEILLMVNDAEKPVYNHSFLDSMNAQQWYGVFSSMVVQEQPEVKQPAAAKQQVTAIVTETANATSVADELQKLASLHDTGVISNEEFFELKSKIIAGK